MAPQVQTLDNVVQSLVALPSGRRLVAVAGAPGSGKSTLADILRDRVLASGRRAEVFGMDGYHYDDAVLEARGLRPRKGAPETFDVAGFRVMLERLARNAEPEIAVPVFDRAIEISRAGARIIPQETEVLIVEGNYLLLQAPGWSDLRFDLTVWLDVPEPVLRDRLRQRWADAGLPEAEISARVDGNDLPNGRLVAAQSRAADMVIRAMGAEGLEKNT